MKLAETEYRRRLGSTIVQLRAIATMSQAELAERLGRSEAAVSRWENGRAMPTAYDLARLADIFEAPGDLFLDPPAAPASPVAVLLEAHARAGLRRGQARAGQRRADATDD